MELIMENRISECISILNRMRNLLLQVGSKSSTSTTYQDDIAQYILENAKREEAIIEIGCFKGGLTAQLAFMAKVTASRLYTIDIDPTWVSHTESLLQRFNLNTHTTYYCGTFDDFARTTIFTRKPLLLVIDGDHRYEAVVKDIQSIYKLNQIPKAVAFHDFSLRYVEKFNTFVDRAIFDSFGQDIELIRIGQQIDDSSYMPKKANPDPKEGFYWEEHGSEGVILFPPEELPSDGKIV